MALSSSTGEEESGVMCALLAAFLAGGAAGCSLHPTLRRWQARALHCRDRWCYNPNVLLPSFGRLPLYARLTGPRWPQLVPWLRPSCLPSLRRVGMECLTLQRSTFTTLWHVPSRIPLWCGYYVTPHGVAKARLHRRPERFRPDSALPQGMRWRLAQMRRPGYDRGHLAPHATVASTPAAAHEAAFLTNVVLQHSQVNQGVWLALERAVREYVCRPAGRPLRGRKDAVLQPFLDPPRPWWAPLFPSTRRPMPAHVAVCAGPLFYRGSVKGPLHAPPVPDALYMCVLDPNTHHHVAFIVPNRAAESDQSTPVASCVPPASRRGKKKGGRKAKHSKHRRPEASAAECSAEKVRLAIAPYIVPLNAVESAVAMSMECLSSVQVEARQHHRKRADMPIVLFPFHRR